MKSWYSYLLSVGCIVSLASCCHNETVQCHDGSLPITFRGFSKSELETVQISYLMKGTPGRVVLSIYRIDSSQVYPYGPGQYTGAIAGTDTADIEISLPSASRTYLIRAEGQQDKRQSEEQRVCNGLFDKVVLDCTNTFPAYTLDGVRGKLDSTGAMIVISK